MIPALARLLDRLRPAERIPFTRTELRSMINRRAEIEDLMMQCARGVRPMPTRDELRQWALKLGTPDDWRNFGRGRR